MDDSAKKTLADLLNIEEVEVVDFFTPGGQPQDLQVKWMTQEETTAMLDRITLMITPSPSSMIH